MPGEPRDNLRSCDCSGQGQSRGYQATLIKESVKKKPKLEAEDQSDTIRESIDKRIFHKAKGFEQVGGSVAGHSGRTEDARGRERGKAEAVSEFLSLIHI